MSATRKYIFNTPSKLSMWLQEIVTCKQYRNLTLQFQVTLYIYLAPRSLDETIFTLTRTWYLHVSFMLENIGLQKNTLEKAHAQMQYIYMYYIWDQGWHVYDEWIEPVLPEIETWLVKAINMWQFLVVVQDFRVNTK